MSSIFDCYSDIIPEFGDFSESIRNSAPLCLRVNTLKTQSSQVVELFRNKGVILRSFGEEYTDLFEARELTSPGNHLEYFMGYIHPQALTSCVVSLVLSPRPESHILDMCASPGGKTSHLAQLMNNSGMIVANELFHNRHISLAHTMARLGVMNTIFTAYQAQEFPLKQLFDYVLADVPCSGEGRIRLVKKEMNIPLNRDTPFYKRLISLQKKIITRGYDLLKKNGVMLYSTCTYNPDENEGVVDYLLRNRDADLLPIDETFCHAPGLITFKEKKYDRRLRKTARFYPHRLDSVGFFMARIVRR
jgi:tRNA (cytosine49-C5)-methyltransferase